MTKPTTTVDALAHLMNEQRKQALPVAFTDLDLLLGLVHQANDSAWCEAHGWTEAVRNRRLLDLACCAMRLLEGDTDDV